MTDDSLYPIQGKSGSDSSIPLVLFHDAGGTIVPYMRLGSLDRPVYGMPNLHFEQGGDWEHGLRQMGVVYAHRVRATIPRGKIILGGWSFGGCVALEVASRLMLLPQYEVHGVLMIDSLFPGAKGNGEEDCCPQTVEDVAASFSLPDQLTSEQRLHTQQCILHAHKILQEWQPPRFPTYPTTVLLRASDPVYKDRSAHHLDRLRDSKHLGWEEYSPSLISTSRDLPGHHFSIFDGPNSAKLTDELRVACQFLEGAR